MSLLGRSGPSSWEGTVALVTGGSRGIGLATARAFLEGGARVAICALDGERLRRAQQDLGGGERLLAETADVRDPGRLTALLERVEQALGPVDVAVANAGVLHVGPFAEQPYEGMDAVIDVNLKGVMHTVRAVLPGMLARGRGVIVNVSSGAGLSGFPDVVSYCASKFGVVGFTEALDQELRGRGVRAHAVCPGRVATDMQVQYSGERQGIAPERVAERILALADPRSRARSGGCVTVGS